MSAVDVCCYFLCYYSAVNAENREMNKVRNQITGEYDQYLTLPDTTR